MPQSDTVTARDGTKAARSNKPAGGGGFRGGSPDPVRTALVAAADTVMRQDLTAIADQIGRDLGSQLEQLLPGGDPTSGQDPCTRPRGANNAPIAGFCFTRKQAIDQAKFTCDGATEDAMTAFAAARRTWTRALGQYDFSMKTAQIALDQAVTTAIAACASKSNPDSGSRKNSPYFTQKQAIAAAMLAFEGSAASAGTSFAASTGALFAAYQTYLTTVETAAAQQLDDLATAQQVFWQSVEGVLGA